MFGGVPCPKGCSHVPQYNWEQNSCVRNEAVGKTRSRVLASLASTLTISDSTASLDDKPDRLSWVPLSGFQKPARKWRGHQLTLVGKLSVIFLGAAKAKP